MTKEQEHILYHLISDMAGRSGVGDIKRPAMSTNRNTTTLRRQKAIRALQALGFIKLFRTDCVHVDYIVAARDAHVFAAAGWTELHMLDTLETIEA